MQKAKAHLDEAAWTTDALANVDALLADIDGTALLTEEEKRAAELELANALIDHEPLLEELVGYAGTEEAAAAALEAFFKEKL